MTTPIRAAAIAAMFLFTGPAFAQARSAGDMGGDTATRVGILGGFEFEDDTGIGLRADVELMPLAPMGRGTVKLLGSIGWTHYGEEEGGIDVTTNVFRFIPGVRLSFPLQDQLGFYADGGLGLYHARLSVDEIFIPGFGTVGGDDTETHLMLRFAAGGFYEVSESLRVVAELGVQPHFGDFDINPVTLFGGVSFAF